MKVLMSIKPEFATKIFEGAKGYEYRKRIFRNSDISTIVVYSSSPIKKVIGEIEIESIITDPPETIWQKTSSKSGISKSFFDSYFADTKLGFAIKIKSTKKYKRPLKLIDFDVNFPPQSFIYINDIIPLNA